MSIDTFNSTDPIARKDSTMIDLGSSTFDDGHQQPAATNVDEEQNTTLMENLRRYRSAGLWAAAMSCSNIMEGFNISLGSGLIIYPPFARKYGEWDEATGSYQVTFQWQMAISLGATVGGIIGAVLGGTVIERIGARLTIILTNIFLIGAIFISFYAPNVKVLFAGTLINGLPWGMLASVGSIYSSEVCPTALRGYLINFCNVAWTIGLLVSAGVLQVYSTNPTDWSYRIPFALQWMWPVPLILIAAFAPTSPWWLIRRGELEKARAALVRLSNGLSDEQINQSLARMKQTNDYEQNTKVESTYKDCFKGTNLRRTEIACVALSAQGLTGSALAQSPTYFMRQAGLAPKDAFSMNIGAMAIGLVGNFVCWGLMAKFGRRSLFTLGLIGSTISLLLIGVLDAIHSKNVPWGQAALCLLWFAIYSAMVAPESYTIAGEISATRVRVQTMSLSKSFFGITACAGGMAQSYMVNPTGARLKGKSAYVWFAFSLLWAIWAYYRLPETKGRTYEELDILFDNYVSARHFKSKPVVTLGDKTDVAEDGET